MSIRTAVACGMFTSILLVLTSARAAGPVLSGKDTPLKPLATGLKNPTGIAIGADQRVYLCVADGVVVLRNGEAVPFASDLEAPQGLARFGEMLVAVERDRVLRIDRNGKVAIHVEAAAFPRPPVSLDDVETDARGNVYVSDAGNGKGGAVFHVSAQRKVGTLVDASKSKEVSAPRGLLLVGESHLHLIDSGTGRLLRARLGDGELTPLADGFGNGDGLARDHLGRLYVSDSAAGKVFVIPRQGQKPVLLASGFQSVRDLCLSADGTSILVADAKGGALYAVPCTVPGLALDESPLPVRVETAFEDLEWTGWTGESSSGKVVQQRPIVLTHAGDGSDRIFVATQRGVIHVFPNSQKAKKTKIFLDIQNLVSYRDEQNEEGFLGLAFPPGYKNSGDFYVYYTPRREKGYNYLSRFRVTKDGPDRADPESEEILIKFKKPFWNHDGGTICFGPDGFLYVAVGDGGAANDPFDNGQNLGSLLGKIHRIDVRKKGENTPYAIPSDNPFVSTKGVLPEIWAYGLRNVWRMSFDRKTGRLWAADVGQNLWEEINLIEKGGNYGWNRREAFHPFGVKGVGPNEKMIDPVWEYHHDLGKSITGGHVYRGMRVPELTGLYLYADYVTGHIWGLRYEEAAKRVTANHLLRQGGFPVFSFGEDEQGEVYLLTATTTGKGISRFTSSK